MKKIEKIEFEIDPFNRLVFAKSKRQSKITKFRHVIDGIFRIDKDNVLTYQLKSPSPPTIPRQLKLTGNWSLDKEHNLVLTLDKENNQKARDKLTLRGEIIAAKADALSFLLSTKDTKGNIHLYILELTGKWQVDRYNRLSFMIKKEHDLHDELTLCGSWEVNAQNQLIYTYTKTILKRKTKLLRQITLKGFWDINEKYRISYVLDKEINSCLDFKASLAKPTKRGLLYEIGIGAKPVKRKFRLLGSWKVNPKIGLLFEMPYEAGKIRSIIFEANCTLGNGYYLDLRLKNVKHRDLGINLKLSKSLFKNQGQAFFAALKQGKEVSFTAGLGFRW